MRVVLVDTTMTGPESGGGGHTFLVDLAIALVERGVEVHIVVEGKPSGRLASLLAGSGAALHARPWGSTGLMEDAAPAFARWISAINPAIYTIGTSADIGWAVLPHLSPEVATVAVAQSDAPTYYKAFAHYAPSLSGAVGVSQTICERLVRECHLQSDRVTWIPYGVHPGPRPTLADERACRKPLHLAYVGRLVDSPKRASDVIRIVERLRKSPIPYTLSVAGDGPLLGAFESRLSPEVSEGRVTLCGWLNRDQLLRTLRASDVFLLTSALEGFCIALVEAMANGLAPLVTDIPSGNRQLVRDHENGFLVRVGDIDAFVNHIERLASDRAFLHSLRLAAWQTGQSYGLPRMADAYTHCFAAAIETARLTPREWQPGFPLMESCRSRYPLWLRRVKYGWASVIQQAIRPGIEA